MKWRLIKLSADADNINFLSKGSFIRPYTKLKIGNIENVLKGVKIGQNPEIDLCKKSIKELLKSKDKYKNVQLSTSVIPYRG